MTTVDNNLQQSLETLAQLEKHEFHLVALADLFPTTTTTTTPATTTPTTTTPTIDDQASNEPTAAKTRAELDHYKDLFSKLHVSYVEQVTKEKFIRAIVGDPPLIVTAAENAALERDNAAAKARLKQLKLDVAATARALDALATSLAARYEDVQRKKRRLGEELPRRVAEVKGVISRLEEETGASGTSAFLMAQGMGEARRLVEDKRQEATRKGLEVGRMARRAAAAETEVARLVREVELLVARREEGKRETERIVRARRGEEMGGDGARADWARVLKADGEILARATSGL